MQESDKGIVPQRSKPVDRNIHTDLKNNTNQAFWAAVGSLISFLFVILLASLLSRILPKSDYGTYRQILFIYGSLTVIFSAGLPKVFSYYLPRYRVEEGYHIVTRINYVLIVLGSAFSFTLFMFSETISEAMNNPSLSQGLRVFSPVPLFTLPALGIEGIFSAYRNTFYIAIYNLISKSIGLTLVALPTLLIKSDHIHAIYGMIISSIFSLALAVYFKGIPFKGFPKSRTNLGYKEILNYCFPLIFAGLWGMASKAADQFYISRFYGPNVFAEFSNGFIEIPFVAMITGAAASVLTPLLSKLHHETGKSGIKEGLRIWRQAMVKSALLIYPIVMFFSLNATPIINFIYSESYSESVSFFRVSMFLNIFNIIIFAPLLLATGRTRFYYRVHLFFGISSWLCGYIAITISNSPLAIAITSCTLSILKIATCLVYLSSMFRISLVDFVPFRELIVILIHSLTIAVCCKFLIDYFPISKISGTVNLFSNLALFSFTVFMTGKLFKFDYISLVRPAFVRADIK